MTLRHTIKAIIEKGEQSVYVGYCSDLPVTTQGETVDETKTNLTEAVALHLEDENLQDMGLAENFTLAL